MQHVTAHVVADVTTHVTARRTADVTAPVNTAHSQDGTWIRDMQC